MKNTIYAGIFLLLVACSGKKQADKKPEVKEQKEVTTKTVDKALNTEVDKSGMVYFEGGKITIGSDNGQPLESPMFEMEIAPFYLDINLVTVAQFRKFIQATGHKTDAEKYGDSGVFDFQIGNWQLLKGTTWEFPLGPDQPKAEDNHPVTHVSWNDAMAYAKWVGKRLPTEFEWEYAAKNGGKQTGKYAWGDEVIMGGTYMANTYQGEPGPNPEALDGYLRTSPVGAFGKHPSGLTDMGGNVWQWCANVFEPYPGNTASPPAQQNVKSTRGGSFMFDQARDLSFTTTFRAQNSDDTSLFNTGFRCAL
ncbi:formylglycine-generating enzyme family protein [Reichenbachiella versicolor]|uniref:formylglycine-generating enzyme family protein n=1 Tax=Reichenbachiella versicolor TaxID=1821036 RepID=UPI000D6E4CC7|nr:formylglycine-generating enzyme family protein [Reichenbachiella versicolor]